METIYFHSKRGCLSYLTFDKESKEGVLIDPSEEINTDEYLNSLKDKKINLLYIIENLRMYILIIALKKLGFIGITEMLKEKIL